MSKSAWRMIYKTRTLLHAVPEGKVFSSNTVPISKSPSFDGDFVKYYNNTGKRAGTYVLKDRQWSRQE